MSVPAVGLLSPGEMGHVVGRALRTHGVRVLSCLQGRSQRTRTLAQQADIEEVESYEELVRQTDLLLSILVPAEAENAARSVAQGLREAGESIIYVDCNAVAPATVRRIAEIITGTGAKFVDASIIGPPPTQQGTTRFYASGADVEGFVALANFGLDIRPIGPEIGQASGIKMCYAALTKGLIALSTELLVAARTMGLYEALIEEFQLSQPERYHAIEMMLPSMPPKARRWIGEMEQIATTFDKLGLFGKIHQGAADIYRFVANTPLASETPETRDRNRTLEQLVDLLSKSSRADT